LLPLYLLPPSFNFPNGVFVSLRVSSYEIYPQIQPYSSSFKGKTTAQKPKNRMGKRKAAKRTEATREKLGYHRRGSHHGLAMAATMIRPWCSLAEWSRFPLRCILVHLLGLRVLPWIIHLGPIGLVLLALLT